MDIVDIQAMESKLNDVTVTAIPMTKLPHGLTVTQHPPSKSHFHQQQQQSVTIQSATAHHQIQQQLQKQQKQLQQQQQQQAAVAAAAAQSLSRISADVSLSPAANYSYNGVSLTNNNANNQSQSLANSNNSNNNSNNNGMSKYAQLLSVIEEMGRDIRPTYANGRSSGERLKRSIIHAKVSVAVEFIEFIGDIYLVAYGSMTSVCVQKCIRVVFSVFSV